MYRTLVSTILLAGGLALAQDTPPQESAQKDRSTAKTQGETNRMMNQANDKKFAMDAAIGGMAEVKLGQLAAEKATNAEVKEFGQRMVTDHTKANDDLKAVASKQSIDLPTSLDAKHQAVVDKFSKMSGEAFDKAYMKEMVKDHDTDVKEFQHEAQNGQDSAVRDFATKTLPTLQDHQKAAHDLDHKLMTSGKGASDRSKQ